MKIGLDILSCSRPRSCAHLKADNPRGDASRPVLRAERSQWNVLPLLNIAGAPVVHDDEAEDPVLRLGHGDGRSWRVGGTANEESHLELEVEKLAGTEDGTFFRVVFVLLELPLRSVCFFVSLEIEILNIPQKGRPSNNSQLSPNNVASVQIN